MTRGASDAVPALYAVSVTPLAEEESFARAYALASPARREKTDRLRMAADKRRSLGAELLLRHALGLHTGEALPPIAYGSKDKPFFPNGGVCFSLSHAGDYALCAVAPEELGCDIERRGRADMKLAARFFHPEEVALLTAAPEGAERDALFTRIWTLKESFLKATGRGLTLPMNEFSVCAGEMPTLRQSLDARAFALREYAEVPGYAVSVCCVGSPPETLRVVTVAEILNA